MTTAGGAEIERRLERFIVEELLEEGYDERDPLATGAIDSLGIEQILAFVAEEWAVELDDEELIAANFESIPVLAALVGSKRPIGAGGP
jgi:acyl carrier protein